MTTLIIMTAWCGYYFGALKSGLSSFSWSLFHTLLGIGLVSGGTAALNEVMEWETDGHMHRAAPNPGGGFQPGARHTGRRGDDPRRRPTRICDAFPPACLSRDS